MSMEDKRASRIHFNMALIGGYLSTYGLLSRGNFPCSETSNMISILTLIIGHRPSEVLTRLGSLVVYVSAIGLCTWLPKHTQAYLPRLSLMIDTAAAILIALIPLTADPFLALYPLFFSSAFQWCSFKGARGFSSATIFSTNNLRQFSSAAVEVWLNHDSSFLDQFYFFGETLLSFHIGVVAAALLTMMFETKASLFCLLPIASAWLQVETAGHRIGARQIA